MPTLCTRLTERRLDRRTTQKLLPSGCDQQRRYATRAERYEQWPDTIATNWGSADAVGDDQAERGSNWGAIDESAAPEGGRHREPSKAVRDEGKGLLASLLWPLALVAAVAGVAALLPSGWPMAWPLG
jgi:hypothetical protein